MKQYLSNFDSPPFTCDPTLFSGKNIPNIAKSNPIFPGKGREDKDFILTYLVSSMTEVFPHYCLFFDFGQIQEEKTSQSWTKSANFGSDPCPEILESIKKCSNSVFISQSITSGENFGNIGPYWGSKDPKTSQKGFFRGC